MKRAVVYEASKPLRLTDYAIPTPPSKGAVVKITYSGVCHSDINFWEGFDSGPGLKEVAPGHEIAGVVEALGDSAGTELNVGDNVVVYPWLKCLECALCVGWRPNLCNDIRYMLGCSQHGGFATHVVVPIVERTVLRIPRGLTPEVACMLPCSGITTYNAVLNTRDTLLDMVGLRGKANLLVIGAGGLGLWCIQFAKHILPPEVSVFSADITEEKLKLAQDANADGTILWTKGANEEALLAHTREISGVGKIGFDAVIDLVGSEDTSRRAYELQAAGGIQVTVGLFGGKLTLDLPSHTFSSKCVKGVLVGTPHHLEEVLKLVAEKKLKPPPTEFYSLEQITDVLNRLKDGQIKGRAILKM
ncbi:uncharacterized protein LOC106176799 [Lingula anatina]|uniref:Uncharacterized protein LOC106176799 n=1 Tax=Lingula anatina TaxID=7574 RepID=A0A1S3JWI2_LINAN|nr:uncharacterized protein LOC106176799 [Lingula anatina]|eukprot:XP_013414785.1 uncharacterized protein LOC106176799 [Lingula anatina]